MPSAYPKDRLQPSLLDRLEDGLAPTLSRLGEARSALDALLDGAQRAALAELLDGGRFDAKTGSHGRPPWISASSTSTIVTPMAR